MCWLEHVRYSFKHFLIFMLVIFMLVIQFEKHWFFLLLVCKSFGLPHSEFRLGFSMVPLNSDSKITLKIGANMEPDHDQLMPLTPSLTPTVPTLQFKPLDRSLANELGHKWRKINWSHVFQGKCYADKYFMRSGLIRKDSPQMEERLNTRPQMVVDLRLKQSLV